ncbi:MAG: magnesium transporter, partial [Proteobacteria bacterium]|nr:magnesium transporter [Pseudomonadota bacterium]
MNKIRSKLRHFEERVHRGLTQSTYLAVLKALQKAPAKLGPLLADLYPADIADLLERLPRHLREEVLASVPLEHLGDVIAELEEGVKEHILQILRPEEVRVAISEMESDDAADAAQTVEDITDESGPDAADLIADKQDKNLLDYDSESAGGLMQTEVVTATPSQTVMEIIEYIRNTEDAMPNNPGTVFVLNDQRKLVGTVSLQRLIKAPPTAALQEIMRQEPLTVTAHQPRADVVKIFEKYNIHNLAVVNDKQELLGRITIDDVLDVVQAEAARQQARAAGVDESEDLFSPASHTMQHRLPWLIINLGTAIMASAVIALFENSIAQITTLAVLMPIVASMGGNATTQTQTVIIRGLALGQITRQNAFDLLKKEFLAGGYVGTILALFMAVGVWLIYQNHMLAVVIALATLANHL